MFCSKFKFSPEKLKSKHPQICFLLHLIKILPISGNNKLNPNQILHSHRFSFHCRDFEGCMFACWCHPWFSRMWNDTWLEFDWLTLYTKQHNWLNLRQFCYFCEKKCIKGRIELGLFSQIWCHDTLSIQHEPSLPCQGGIGSGNASQIRVSHLEEYNTVSNCTVLLGGNRA